jgi:hypothetical protein
MPTLVSMARYLIEYKDKCNSYLFHENVVLTFPFYNIAEVVLDILYISSAVEKCKD